MMSLIFSLFCSLRDINVKNTTYLIVITCGLRGRTFKLPMSRHRTPKTKTRPICLLRLCLCDFPLIAINRPSVSQSPSIRMTSPPTTFSASVDSAFSRSSHLSPVYTLLVVAIACYKVRLVLSYRSPPMLRLISQFYYLLSVS